MGRMTIDPQKIDTVLLDIDGTLVDSTYLHAHAWMRAFQGIGESPPWFRVHRAIGMGGDKLVGHVLGDRAEEEHGDALRSRWSEEYAAMLGELPAFPGATDLARRLKEQGLRVALASSGEPQFTDKALEVLGLSEDEVDAVTSADDVDDSKPDPDLLDVALSRAGGRHGVLVGDTTWDVAAAQRSGMPCVAVLTGGFCEAELRSAGAAEVVESVADLLEHDWSQLG